jgi:hypothetical protein
MEGNEQVGDDLDEGASGLDGDSCDAMLSVLSNRVRRHVLYYLSDRQEQVGVDRLAGELAADLQNDANTMALNLRHVHLPRLDEAGVVDYETDEETVVVTERANLLPIPDLVPVASDPHCPSTLP